MNQAIALLQELKGRQDSRLYEQLSWSGNFTDYLDGVLAHPDAVRTSFQRMYDMILSHGTEEYVDTKKRIVRYKFFTESEIARREGGVFGLDIPLEKLVNFFKAAALKYGPEKRVLLLHGPVGSAKSTIVRMLKRGVEAYSRTPEGAMYTFSWREGFRPESEDILHEMPCPIHEEPLHLIPKEYRAELLGRIHAGGKSRWKVEMEGDLCPTCRYIFTELMKKYGGDWLAVLDRVRVHRLILSEQDRVGIGTFQPKDEKNQDSTELTGDINYRKIALYGSDSDPRAFNFDGEFNIANRGVVEFIEMLKLDVAFLYDLLGASQEHLIKPKKFAQTHIDEVIIGHTNEPEYRKLQENQFMEALRDRTVKIDIPYITRLSDEIRIYDKDFNGQKIQGKHIAPHSIEVAAMWAVLTRLEEPKKAGLSLLQKMKLYNGKTLPGYSEENVKELRKEAEREGMLGISPRYIQDKISNALVDASNTRCINPFMVLNHLEAGLRHHSLISSESERAAWRELLAVVKQEYEDLVKNEVQRAICADEEALAKLCSNYIDNVKAYTQKERVKNRYTGQDEEPDERLMRSIESKIDIPESRKDDFRREIMNYIAALSLDGKVFNYKANERLYKALEAKLFEDQKDFIKLSTLVTGVVDRETQEKIDIVKARLVRDYGYCDSCGEDVLAYVSSIFARGEATARA